MKSLMLLYKSIARDMAIRCRTSTTTDLKTVSDRVKNEGLSFLTITLPNFGKDFERSLDQGFVSRQDFQGFKWKSGLPAFLGGFLELIFDSSSGRLLDDPDVEAILAVRQLTLTYSKLFMLSNEKRERAAMKGFIECEYQLSNMSTSQDDFRKDFIRVGNIVLGRVLKDLDVLSRDPYNFLPDHGPGATADGVKGNRKWEQKTWPVRLNRSFPMDLFLLPNHRFIDDLDDVELIEPGSEIPVKVISVPKTQKTPRIIAMEPVAMQFAQQSVRRMMYDAVENDYVLNSLIGFTDQTPNQRLACIGSVNSDLATLDLSEASDRVHLQHVVDLFSLTPSLRDVVLDCRSTKAAVPGHGTVSLSKFASMGSALSFPIEAMVFITIIFMGIEDSLNRPLTYKDVKSFIGKVRVFGDDIIVPKDFVEPVITRLHSFGMKVNDRKSFWNGKFRESCGKEYYSGHDVSIVKVRSLAPSNRADVTEVISWVSLRNQMYFSGMWNAARWLDSFLGKIIDFPVVGVDSSVLGRHTFLPLQEGEPRGRYQIPMVMGFRIVARSPVSNLENSHALNKWFLLRGDLPIVDEDHLERSGRPHVVNIKRGWNPLY